MEEKEICVVITVGLMLAIAIYYFVFISPNLGI